MVPGEKRRMWIPAAIAGNPQQRPDIPPGDLVMDVQRVEIVPTPKPPSSPKTARRSL
jgi:hypothetical protein